MPICTECGYLLHEVDAGGHVCDPSELPSSGVLLRTRANNVDLVAQSNIAITRLDDIIANVESGNNAYAKTAMKDMAKYQKKIIKRLVQIDIDQT